MNTDLRDAIPRALAPWLREDEVAVRVVEVEIARRDARLQELWQQAEVPQDEHRGGLYVDADPQSGEGGGGLEDVDVGVALREDGKKGGCVYGNFGG